MQPSKINFYQVRGIGAVINATSEFIRENFKPLFKSVLYIAGPFILISSILFGLLQTAMLNFQAEMASGQISTPSSMFSYLGKYYPLSVVFSFLGFFFLTVVAYEYILLYNQKEEKVISVSEVWARVRKDWWLITKTFLGLILVWFVFVLLMALISVLIGVIGGGLAALVSFIGSPVIGAIISFLAMVAFILVILTMLSPIALIFNIRVNERLKFFSSLSRCYDLTSGNRLKTVGILVLCMFIQMTLSFVLMIPYWLNFIFTINSTSTSSSALEILSVVSTSVLMVATYMLGVIFITAISFHYYSLLEKKESAGLKLKVNSFGTSGSSGTQPASANEEY